MKTTVEYSIAVYASGVNDADCCWYGSDKAESERQLAIMRKRFPGAPIRYSTHTYFEELEQCQSE